MTPAATCARARSRPTAARGARRARSRGSAPRRGWTSSDQDATACGPGCRESPPRRWPQRWTPSRPGSHGCELRLDGWKPGRGSGGAIGRLGVGRTGTRRGRCRRGRRRRIDRHVALHRDIRTLRLLQLASLLWLLWLTCLLRLLRDGRGGDLGERVAHVVGDGVRSVARLGRGRLRLLPAVAAPAAT